MRTSSYASTFLRLALAAAFLAAVSDRFGWWGPPGARNVAWGDFAQFEGYTATLNWYLPQVLIPAVAWFVTVLETALALGLLLGVATQWVALASGALLLLFALAMTAALGIKAPLNYSVYSASAGAFVLSTMRDYRWALENLRGRRGASEAARI
jgi:uncharacterized membrane protein YphA (DoxX/SURF4 family)